MYLGIEIGGTKLQLGVGLDDGSPLVALDRLSVVPTEGAAGILRQIETAARPLIARHNVMAIGVGFGGPVDARWGRAIKSHQIEGWDDFPLVEWFSSTLGLRATIGNDCDVAGLAEARFGAGRGKRVVFYVTVGTGIGGGLVIDGQIHSGSGRAATEIGHLRPGPAAITPEQTVESIASGWGIERGYRKYLTSPRSPATTSSEKTTQQIALLAEQGDSQAMRAIQDAVQTLGWAMAQVVTLLAPEIIVLGGGVSLMKPALFLDPLREQVARYVFPPLAGSYTLQPAALGEEVVVHGALALAAR